VEIEGRSFVVTGAGSGLGRATAVALAGRGGRVVCVDIALERAQTIAEEAGGGAIGVCADVTSEAEIAVAIEAAGDTLAGGVSCAGIAITSRVLGREGPHPLGDFARVVMVNLVGTFNVARLLARALARTDPNDYGERGVLVHTASIAAFDGQIGQAAYAASKGGVAALTLPLARDLAQFGIRCVTIAPGIFDTPMLAGLSEPARQSLAEQVPFPSRLGDPAEFAALAVHVIRNPMLNGTVIRLDGALRMAPR
jgi:NAD(P)-dependent dehydrogenase (short-subunit alcohol dehydrogenase family)